MSESSVGLLRTIRLPRFLRGINRWIRDDLQPNMVLWDNRWYRTPKGMILRLPEELEADHPFKMSLTQKQNGKQWVATFSYGYVHVGQWGYSGGGSGYFTGVNQWGVELNSRLLTSTPKPELVIGAWAFNGLTEVVVSMPFGWSGEADFRTIRDSGTPGATHKARRMWVQYNGPPSIILWDGTPQPGRIFWTIARLGSEPGSFTQRLRSDIFAPSVEHDRAYSWDAEQDTDPDPAEEGEDQEVIFDQNPVDPEPAGPPHPVPSGPPPPTSNTGGVDPIQPPEPI